MCILSNLKIELVKGSSNFDKLLEKALKCEEEDIVVSIQLNTKELIALLKG